MDQETFNPQPTIPTQPPAPPPGQTLQSPPPPAVLPSRFPIKKLALLTILVLVLIILAVAAIYLPNLNQVKKHDNQRKANLTTIAQALERSRSGSKDNLYYPSAITSATLEKTGYITKIPTDPINQSPHVYTYIGSPRPCVIDCTGYTLTACLENKNDKGKNTIAPVSPCTTRTYQLTRP